MLKTYFQDIFNTTKTDDATEESYYSDLKQLVKGFMVESFLKEGHQTVNAEHPEAIDSSGLSITDPCLSWEKTEALLLQLAGMDA